jgi:TatD DNase family protein
MAWIDTHCHLDAPELRNWDADARRRARDAGMALCVIPAVAVANFGAVRDRAHAFGDAYALGIHPMCTAGAGDDDLARLEAALRDGLADDPRLVAVGEIGLDYFVPGLDDAHQQRIHRAQLRLARRFDLPVLLHTRRSVDRVLQHLRQLAASGPPAGAGRPPWRGIAHAFTGSLQQAQAFIDLGFKLGFGGALTFDRATHLRRMVAELPLDAIVLETDAPDIPPRWVYRTAEERAGGLPQGVNTPAEVPRIAEAVAELRGMPVAELAGATTRNAVAAMPRIAALL